MKQYADLDFVKAAKILSVLIDPVASDDTGLGTGQLWFNTTSKFFKGYDGTNKFSLLRDNLAATVTGVFTFNPSTGSVPFVLDSGMTSVVTYFNADQVDGYDAAEAATASTLAARDASGSLTVATPSSDGHAATKAYVDSIAAGQDWKDSCRVATTANITLSGTQTIDGVSVVADDRVLVKDQTTGSENGLYVCAAGAWSRASDADADAEVTSGLTTFIEEGTANAGAGFTLTTSGTIVVGTTSLTFTKTSGGSVYGAGNGMVKSGTTFHFAQSASYTTGALPYASGASTIGFIAAVASGKVLKSNGTSTVPLWAAVDLTADVTGTLPVANGGTGTSTQATQGAVFFAGASGILSTDASNLFWDDTNNRLCIGANSGSNTLSVTGTGYFSGNVGIGTTTPNEQLEITGNFRLPATTATTGIIYRDGDRFLHTFQHPTGDTAVPTGNNLFIGEGSGNFTTGATATSGSHASNNVGVGRYTLDALTTGYQNVVIGNSAGSAITSGLRNALGGQNSGDAITSGNYNSGWGYGALSAITVGDANTAFGALAADAATTSIGLTSIGYQSLTNLTSGNYTVALGYYAARFAVGGADLLDSDYGIAIGYDVRLTEGSTNEIVIGKLAEGNGSNTVTLGGDDITKTILKGNVGIGTTSPNEKLEITGNFRLPATTATTGIIYRDGNRFIHTFRHPTGSTAIPVGRNTFIGEIAGNLTLGSTATSTSHGSFNNGVGYAVLDALTTGYGNNGFGYSVLTNVTTGHENSAFGTLTLSSLTTGVRNSALGKQALTKVTTGSYNVGVGSTAGYNITEGDHNIAIGSDAVLSNVTQDAFIGIGRNALQYLTVGNYTVGLGPYAGRYQSIGGNLTDSSYSIFIGYDANGTEGAANEIVVGKNAEGNGSNTTTLGGAETVQTYLMGKLWVETFDASVSNSVVTENSGVLEKRTIYSGAWTGDADTVDGYEAAALLDLANSTGDTDDISEGLTNLYYTDARARAALSSTDSAEIAYNNSTGVLGLGTEASRVKSGTIGDGASTSLTFTHNLGTRNVICQVFRTASPYDEVRPEIKRTTTSSVTIEFTGITPAAGEFTVVCDAANG
jgi:hypothetical protein